MRPYLALLAAILGISWSAIFVRWAGVPGVVSAFYRVAIAAAVLVPWRLSRGAPLPPPRALRLALAAGLFFALDLGLFNTAVLQTSAAKATVLGNNAPVFVGLGTWLVFRRRPAGRFWAGLVLALGGCAVIVSDGWAAASGSLRGDAIALTAAVFWAAYLLTAEQVRATMDTLTFNALAIASSAAALLIICLAMGAPLTGHPPRTWGALLALGLVSQLFSYYCLVYALGHLPATVTSVGLLAQVPLTALLAVPLLGEPITLPLLAGGALVLAGVYLVNRQGPPPTADDRERC